MDKEVLKELESIKKKVSELESQKKDNMSMFGRSYSQVGNSNSDFLIKTKGQVKIQWGSKFIDLIKDGKINVNSKFIYREDTVGTRDGIYVTGKDDEAEVWIVISGTPINLKGTVGNTYVSFLGQQETTSQQKRVALTNIGFLYPDLNSIDSNMLQNGIIYVESEQKLYLIKNGKLEEFGLSLPNPFPSQFIIAKATDEVGAIVIQGTGINNSLAFSDLYIYSESSTNVIQSNKSLQIKASILDILSSQVKLNGTLKVTVIESASDPTNTGGFRIYKNSSGECVLEIDKIFERNSNNTSTQLLPEYWFLNNNIIKTAEILNEGRDTASETQHITLTFVQKHSYVEGDILAVYKKNVQKEDTDEYTPYSLILLEVSSVPDLNMVQAIVPENMEEGFQDGIIGQHISMIQSPSRKLLPLRLQNNNFDIWEYNLKAEIRKRLLRTRIGNLSEIYLEETQGCYGIYTDCLIVDGIDDKNFPKYTKYLNYLLSSINIEDSDAYNDVFVSVGLLKKVIKQNQNTITELQQKVKSLETTVAEIKVQLEQQNTE